MKYTSLINDIGLRWNTVRHPGDTGELRRFLGEVMDYIEEVLGSPVTGLCFGEDFDMGAQAFETLPKGRFYTVSDGKTFWEVKNA